MAKRRYTSTVRAEKAEQTRLRLLEAATELLIEIGVEGLSLPKIAERAEVTAPTAYKYFPTIEALLRAHLEYVRPQIAMSDEDFAAVDPTSAPQLPVRTYRRFERNGTLLRAVMDSPTFQRVRVESRSDRAALVREAFAPAAPDLPPRELRAALGVMFLQTTPSAWRWLRDTWGLSAKDAARAASWAMSVLSRELTKNPASIDAVEPSPEEPQ